MSTSTGLLIVKASYKDRRLCDIRVDLKRPSVTRLFVGQVPDAVAKTVPYLFTLCANAQRAAAQAAVAVALSEAPRAFDSAELWIEVLHENLWRLLLDWPPVLGLRPEKDAFIAWRNARQGGDYLAATQNVLHRSLRPLAGKCLEMLVDRSTEEVAPDDGEENIPTSALLAPEAWLAFWQGNSSQMPVMPLPASIRSVFLARLAETMAAADALAGSTPFPMASAGGDGWGIGQTLTARGVLTHAVHVVHGKVANYLVQAPTDSFFTDAAALSSLLANLEFASIDQARQGLNRAILALDPCVPYVAEVQNA
jgi:uptake hydrogenase large subunit